MNAETIALSERAGRPALMPARYARPSGAAGAHVLAILPRGEAIRNFVYTGTLALAARTVDVSLLSVIPSRDIRDDMIAQFRRVYSLEDASDGRLLGLLRELLDMAHGRWLWTAAARERWSVHDAAAAEAGRVAVRVAKKAACYPFSNRAGLALLSRVEGVASTRAAASSRYVALLRRVRPTLVFNGSHVHSRVATQAVYAAKALGIPTAAFVFSWDNLTSQGRIIPSYDFYFVWNDEIADQLLDMYPAVRREQVLVTGTPQFDFHFRREYHWGRDELCRRVGADSRRPIVLYSTGMANHMPGEPEIVEGIADMLAGMTDLGPPQLLVRVYAKDRTGRFDELMRRRRDILFPETAWEEAWLTPRPEDAFLLTNLLRHAAVGINIASTISLELCMFDKPVVNVGYGPASDKGSVDVARYYEFDHYKPLVEGCAVTVAASEEEMASAVRQALVAPHVNSTCRRQLIHSMFGNSLDGYAAVRVAEHLSRLASAPLRRLA